MKSRNLLKILYLFSLFLLIFPNARAGTKITELLNDMFGIDIDISFLILLISLFFILFFILQKGTQKLFGSTTVANIIALLISLVAIVFMPEELFTFLSGWTIIIVALAFVTAPITLIRLFNIQNKKSKHLVLIILYIVMIWAFSKLYEMDILVDIFKMELPFIYGEATLISIIYWALGIAIIISLIVLIKESMHTSEENEFRRLERRQKKEDINLKIAETKQRIAEKDRILRELKNKPRKSGRTIIQALQLLKRLRK